MKKVEDLSLFGSETIDELLDSEREGWVGFTWLQKIIFDTESTHSSIAETVRRFADSEYGDRQRGQLPLPHSSGVEEVEEERNKKTWNYIFVPAALISGLWVYQDWATIRLDSGPMIVLILAALGIFWTFCDD